MDSRMRGNDGTVLSKLDSRFRGNDGKGRIEGKVRGTFEGEVDCELHAVIPAKAGIHGLTECRATDRARLGCPAVSTLSSTNDSIF